MRVKPNLIRTAFTACLGMFCSAASAGDWVYDCEFVELCDDRGSCNETLVSNVSIFHRQGLLARMDVDGNIIDMEMFGSQSDKRRDFLINGILDQYLAIVTIYQEGKLSMTEHSQQRDGSPLVSFVHGTCELQDQN